MVQGLQRHELICTDSGCGKIFWMDKDGNITRELVVGAACYDVWALPDGNVLYPFFSDKDSGVRVVHSRGKRIVQLSHHGRSVRLPAVGKRQYPDRGTHSKTVV